MWWYGRPDRLEWASDRKANGCDWQGRIPGWVSGSWLCEPLRVGYNARVIAVSTGEVVADGWKR